MRDPRNVHPSRDFDAHLPPGLGGVVSAFAPRGAVGILAGFIVLLLLFAVSGSVQGLGLVAAGVTLVVLGFLTRRALKAEMRREDTTPLSRVDPVLPADSDLSDDDRREAMRRYADGHTDD